MTLSTVFTCLTPDLPLQTLSRCLCVWEIWLNLLALIFCPLLYSQNIFSENLPPIIALCCNFFTWLILHLASSCLCCELTRGGWYIPCIWHSTWYIVDLYKYFLNGWVNRAQTLVDCPRGLQVAQRQVFRLCFVYLRDLELNHHCCIKEELIVGLWCFEDGWYRLAEVATVLAEAKDFMSRNL